MVENSDTMPMGGESALVEAPSSFLCLGLFNSVMCGPCIRAKCGFPAAQANQRDTSAFAVSAVKCLGSFERVSPDEIEARLQKKGLLHPVEKPYDQAKVDLIKAEIIEIYKDYGIAVGADSSLEPTRDRRAVRILIEVYKQ